MKGQLQVFLERSSLREASLYALVFFGLHILLRVALQALMAVFGIDSVAATQVLSDNELIIQVSSLISANYVIKLYAKLPSYWKEFRPKPFFSASLKGFLFASLAVALSLFLGFSAIESSRMDAGALWQLMPGLVLQIVFLMTWLGALEWMRMALSALLVRPDPGVMRGRLAIIGLEAYLYFQLIASGDSALGTIGIGVLSFLVAASSYLSFEMEATDQKSQRSARMTRLGVQAGFWVGVVHIYGQRIGAFKGFSLMHLYDGPLSLRGHWLSVDSSSSQIFSILLLIGLTNTLLQKVLGRLASRSNRL